MAKWLRKSAVAERYGYFVNRSIEYAVKNGRLPAPEYPLGNRIPFWSEEQLDEHDREIVRKSLARRNAATATAVT